MVNERGFASASISPMVKTVKSVCHSTMMHHGDEPHRKMYTSVNVSETVLIFCIFILFSLWVVIVSCLVSAAQCIEYNLVSSIPVHRNRNIQKSVKETPFLCFKRIVRLYRFV